MRTVSYALGIMLAVCLGSAAASANIMSAASTVQMLNVPLKPQWKPVFFGKLMKKVGRVGKSTAKKP
jgi:hypothetical protein